MLRRIDEHAQWKHIVDIELIEDVIHEDKKSEYTWIVNEGFMWTKALQVQLGGVSVNQTWDFVDSKQGSQGEVRDWKTEYIVFQSLDKLQ